jgi:hypothetical protein
MPSWKLIDADIVAAENKYTFFKSSRFEISKVAVGEIVKLIFEFESDDPEASRAERMWVEVSEVLPNEGFKGLLANEPKFIKDLREGDPVEFSACHIINTPHDDDDNIVENYLKRCFVTNRIMKDGEKVRYLYREEPDNDNDSGWRLMRNDESDEYMENADNISFVSLGAVLSKDDSFVDLLNEPAGTAFVFDDSLQKFVSE